MYTIFVNYASGKLAGGWVIEPIHGTGINHLSVRHMAMLLVGKNSTTEAELVRLLIISISMPLVDVGKEREVEN